MPVGIRSFNLLANGLHPKGTSSLRSGATSSQATPRNDAVILHYAFCILHFYGPKACRKNTGQLGKVLL